MNKGTRLSEPYKPQEISRKLKPKSDESDMWEIHQSYRAGDEAHA